CSRCTAARAAARRLRTLARSSRIISRRRKPASCSCSRCRPRASPRSCRRSTIVRPPELRMSPTSIGLFVFACTFGGALGGLSLRFLLPAHHLNEDSRETVKAGIGLIATMTALVLGIVTGSAKSSFDGVNTAIKRVSADLIALDRTLARYGPETAQLRAGLQ